MSYNYYQAERDGGSNPNIDIDLDSDADDDSDRYPLTWHKSPLRVRKIRRHDGRPSSAEVKYDPNTRQLYLHSRTGSDSDVSNIVSRDHISSRDLTSRAQINPRDQIAPHSSPASRHVFPSCEKDVGYVESAWITSRPVVPRAKNFQHLRQPRAVSDCIEEATFDCNSSIGPPSAQQHCFHEDQSNVNMLIREINSISESSKFSHAADNVRNNGERFQIGPAHDNPSLKNQNYTSRTGSELRKGTSTYNLPFWQRRSSEDWCAVREGRLISKPPLPSHSRYGRPPGGELVATGRLSRSQEDIRYIEPAEAEWRINDPFTCYNPDQQSHCRISSKNITHLVPSRRSRSQAFLCEDFMDDKGHNRPGLDLRRADTRVHLPRDSSGERQTYSSEKLDTERLLGGQTNSGRTVVQNSIRSAATRDECNSKLNTVRPFRSEQGLHKISTEHASPAIDRSKGSQRPMNLELSEYSRPVAAQHARQCMGNVPMSPGNMHGSKHNAIQGASVLSAIPTRSSVTKQDPFDAKSLMKEEHDRFKAYKMEYLRQLSGGNTSDNTESQEFCGNDECTTLSKEKSALQQIKVNTSESRSDRRLQVGGTVEFEFALPCDLPSHSLRPCLSQERAYPSVPGGPRHIITSDVTEQSGRDTSDSECAQRVGNGCHDIRQFSPSDQNSIFPNRRNSNRNCNVPIKSDSSHHPTAIKDIQAGTRNYAFDRLQHKIDKSTQESVHVIVHAINEHPPPIPGGLAAPESLKINHPIFNRPVDTAESCNMISRRKPLQAVVPQWSSNINIDPKVMPLATKVASRVPEMNFRVKGSQKADVLSKRSQERSLRGQDKPPLAVIRSKPGTVNSPPAAVCSNGKLPNYKSNIISPVNYLGPEIVDINYNLREKTSKTNDMEGRSESENSWRLTNASNSNVNKLPTSDTYRSTGEREIEGQPKGPNYDIAGKSEIVFSVTGYPVYDDHTVDVKGPTRHSSNVHTSSSHHLSSSAANTSGHWRESHYDSIQLCPNMFTLQDHSSQTPRGFIPENDSIVNPSYLQPTRARADDNIGSASSRALYPDSMGNIHVEDISKNKSMLVPQRIVNSNIAIHLPTDCGTRRTDEIDAYTDGSKERCLWLNDSQTLKPLTLETSDLVSPSETCPLSTDSEISRILRSPAITESYPQSTTTGQQPLLCKPTISQSGNVAVRKWQHGGVVGVIGTERADAKQEILSSDRNGLPPNYCQDKNAHRLTTDVSQEKSQTAGPTKYISVKKHQDDYNHAQQRLAKPRELDEHVKQNQFQSGPSTASKLPIQITRPTRCKLNATQLKTIRSSSLCIVKPQEFSFITSFSPKGEKSKFFHDPQDAGRVFHDEEQQGPVSVSRMIKLFSKSNSEPDLTTKSSSNTFSVNSSQIPVRLGRNDNNFNEGRNRVMDGDSLNPTAPRNQVHREIFPSDTLTNKATWYDPRVASSDVRTKSIQPTNECVRGIIDPRPSKLPLSKSRTVAHRSTIDRISDKSSQNLVHRGQAVESASDSVRTLNTIGPQLQALNSIQAVIGDRGGGGGGMSNVQFKGRPCGQRLENPVRENFFSKSLVHSVFPEQSPVAHKARLESTQSNHPVQSNQRIDECYKDLPRIQIETSGMDIGEMRDYPPVEDSEGEMTDATDVTLDAMVIDNRRVGRPLSPDTTDLSDLEYLSGGHLEEPYSYLTRNKPPQHVSASQTIADFTGYDRSSETMIKSMDHGLWSTQPQNLLVKKPTGGTNTAGTSGLTFKRGNYANTSASRDELNTLCGTQQSRAVIGLHSHSQNNLNLVTPASAKHRVQPKHTADGRFSKPFNESSLSQRHDTGVHNNNNNNKEIWPDEEVDDDVGCRRSIKDLVESFEDRLTSSFLRPQPRPRAPPEDIVQECRERNPNKDSWLS